MSQTTNLGKVCVTPKGTHDIQTAYNILDIVTDNGSSYIAIQNVPKNILITNTDYWQLIAQKGGTGEITGATASISGGYGTPAVSVTEGGTATERTFAFAFENLVGNGIVSITGEKTGTSGNTDTYTMTITYDSGETDTVTYDVTNGSVTSVDGMTGDVDLSNKYATITDLEQGTIVVEHASVADNLTPYSEDSGAIQDTPFISQGTGTGNNSVIVTTGDQAKQLEKLGNAPVVNQKIVNPNFASVSAWQSYLASYTVANNEATVTSTQVYGAVFQDIGAINGHKYLVYGWIKADGTNFVQLRVDRAGVGNYMETNSSSYTFITYIFTADTTSYNVARFTIRIDGVGTCNVKDVALVDLTQWFNGDIPQDVLDNPSHFSWYYNGSLAYNAGEIKYGNGVKLVCLKSRNLWDEEINIGKTIDSATGQEESASGIFCSKNFIPVVPNKPIYVYNGGSGNYISNFRIACYDNKMNYLGIGTGWFSTVNGVITLPPNAWFIKFKTEGATYNHDITFTSYYTPAEGGEGYDQYYPYEEPDIIDTGSEQLGAFDKKTPDGVITRGGSTYTFTGNEGWSPNGSGYTTSITGLSNLIKKPSANNVVFNWQINSAGLEATSADRLYSGANTSGIGIVTNGGIFIGSDDYANISNLTGKTIEFELETPTTEQGASFRQYAGINDYGIMYWLDANDELISVPQGLKIQYPVNYKGFTDDLYMYTNGDATSLAKNESITDTALAERGYLKLTALSGYDATKTQTLKNVQGVFTWVDDQSE